MDEIDFSSEITEVLPRFSKFERKDPTARRTAQTLAVNTTTSRELVMLPSGAMVVDTPGIREIGRVNEAEALLLRGESTHRYRK